MLLDGFLSLLGPAPRLRRRRAGDGSTACGAIGILAPPSLPLIIYGIVSGADIQKLFVAGMVPALVTISVLAIYGAIRGTKMKVKRPAFDGKELWAAGKHGAFALALPVLLLGGIYGGFATAAEASVLAVVYALVVEVGIHREVSLRQLPTLVSDTIGARLGVQPPQPAGAGT